MFYLQWPTIDARVSVSSFLVQDSASNVIKTKTIVETVFFKNLTIVIYGGVAAAQFHYSYIYFRLLVVPYIFL